MNRVGIILNTLGNNQLSYNAINNINLLFNDINYDIILFYEEISNRIIEPSCAVMSACNILGFSGNLIFTELNQYTIIKNLILPNRKIFYMNNIEWLENPNYELNYSILTNQDIKIVCRSNYHADALKRYCGRKSDLIEEHFDIEKIVNDEQ